MTDLYKEAILEAKKLKEIAEADAKKSVIDAISPYIKKAITKQISESFNSNKPGDVSSFFLEQDEEPLDPTLDQAPAPAPTPGAAPTPTTADTSGMSLTSNPVAGDASMSPPLSLSGNGEDVVNSSLDPQDGKITVNFEDLFLKPSETSDDVVQSTTAPLTPSAPSAPAAAPAPALDMPADTTATTAPEAVPGSDEELAKQPLTEKSFQEWKNKLNELSGKVDEAFFSEKTPEVVKESLKNRLFKLLEGLDSLKETGMINSKQIKINENKLEFLFLKLKDGKLNNSYIENEKREENNMTSLKEYAAKLFEETYAEESDKDLNPPTTASAKHAAKVSGVGTDVELNEEALAGTTSEKPWEDGEAGLKEKDQDKVIEEALASMSEGSEGYGDTSEKPTTSFDGSFSESELKEAIKHLRKESVKKKMAKLKEASESSWEDGSPVDGKDPAQTNLSKKLSPSDALKQPKGPGVEVVAEDLELGLSDDEDMDSDEDMDLDGDMEMDSDDDMEMDMDMDGDDADLVINIDLPDEVEAALSDIDLSALDDITASLADVNIGRSEESTESLDDSEEMPVEGMSMPPKAPTMGMMQEAKKRNKLLESKVVAASKALKEQKSQIESLRSELQEANLFIAKSVYFTKCLQRGDLSKANLTKIAEHLDRAKTVQETKEIYSKIKNKLAESVAASKKLIGSSSQATNQGSTPTLNENVNRENDQGDVIASRRWQTLAGIKTHNDK